MLVERERMDFQEGSALPFGYYVEREPELLLLRRSDGTFVAAFSARGVDPFEVESMAWEDAGLVGGTVAGPTSFLSATNSLVVFDFCSK